MSSVADRQNRLKSPLPLFLRRGEDWPPPLFDPEDGDGSPALSSAESYPPENGEHPPSDMGEDPPMIVIGEPSVRVFGSWVSSSPAAGDTPALLAGDGDANSP